MVHENLGELTPAIFRELKKTPTKTRIGRCAFSVRSFPRRGMFQGHTFIKMPRLHLSCKSAAAQIECAGAKAWFCLRKNLIEFYLVIPSVSRGILS